MKQGMTPAVVPKQNAAIITGGSRGFGKALVREFAQRGYSVLFTGRNKHKIAEVVREVRKQTPPEYIVNELVGLECDLTQPKCGRYLDRWISDHFPESAPRVWINNAGISGGFTPFADQSIDTASDIVKTNLMGTFVGVHIAMEHRVPHIFNVVGAGSDGSITPGFAAYGATKAGIWQFTKTLRRELKCKKKAYDVGIHTISPGMMITDLLTENTTDMQKRIFNVFAEDPAIVAAMLMPRLLSIASVDSNIVHRDVKYLTPARIVARMLDMPARNRRFFDV
jgi:chlorophyll(ide) b reductase